MSWAGTPGIAPTTRPPRAGSYASALTLATLLSRVSRGRGDPDHTQAQALGRT